MYYEINVTKNNKHYFATADRSITTLEKLKELLEQFSICFPARDGFELFVNYNPERYLGFLIDPTNSVFDEVEKIRDTIYPKAL